MGRGGNVIRSTDAGVMWICDACGKKIDFTNGCMSWAEDEARYDLHRGEIDCWEAWQAMKRQGTLEFT